MNREDIQKDLDILMADFANKHKIHITKKVYKRAGELEVILNIIPKSKKKEIEETERKNSEFLGYPQNIINLQFVYRNIQYTIVEINLKKRAYPIMVKSPTGKLIAFTNALVRELLTDEYINRTNNLRTILDDDYD